MDGSGTDRSLLVILEDLKGNLEGGKCKRDGEEGKEENGRKTLKLGLGKERERRGRDAIALALSILLLLFFFRASRLSSF